MSSPRKTIIYVDPNNGGCSVEADAIADQVFAHLKHKKSVILECGRPVQIDRIWFESFLTRMLIKGLKKELVLALKSESKLLVIRPGSKASFDNLIAVIKQHPELSKLL